MATNTGIEVTALRPAASAGDFYVRPEANNSGIAQGLERLAGTLNKQRNVEAKITAEELALSESLDAGNVDALHNNEAYAQESPAVMAYLNEIRGKNHASALVSKLTSDWQKRRDGFDDTGADFESFLREGFAQGVEDFKGNRYMMAGASGVFAEASHNLRAQNRQYVDGRTRESLGVEFSTSVGTTALALASGSMTLEAASADIENRIQNISSVGGMTRGAASEASFKSLVAFYTTPEGGNSNVLKLINSHPYITGPKGKDPTRLEGIIMVERAIQTRSDDDYRKQERAYIANEREQDKLKEDTATTIQTMLIKDPTAGIPDALKSAYVKSGGQLSTLESFESNALALQNKPVTQDHTIQYNQILGDIYKQTYHPAKRVKIDDILTDAALGLIHPSQVADLMLKVQQSNQVAPLGQKPEVTTARTRFVESIVGVSPSQSNATRTRAANLEDAFDEGFRQAVTEWYDENTDDPNQTQVTRMLKDLGVELKKIADVDTDEIANEAARNKGIRQATKWAKGNQTRGFGSNPSIENIEAQLAELPQSITDALYANPFQYIKFPKKYDPNQDNPQEQLRPVIEILNEFERGGAHVWMEAHKGDF